MMINTKVTSAGVNRKCLCRLSEGDMASAFPHWQSYLRLKYTSETQAAEVQFPLAEPPYRKQVFFLQMFRPFFPLPFYRNGVKVQSSSAKCLYINRSCPIWSLCVFRGRSADFSHENTVKLLSCSSDLCINNEGELGLSFSLPVIVNSLKHDMNLTDVL